MAAGKQDWGHDPAVPPKRVGAVIPHGHQAFLSMGAIITPIIARSCALGCPKIAPSPYVPLVHGWQAKTSTTSNRARR